MDFKCKEGRDQELELRIKMSRFGNVLMRYVFSLVLLKMTMSFSCFAQNGHVFSLVLFS